MTATCPRCGGALEAELRVCRHCLLVLDRDVWNAHDAGCLGGDGRGRGRPLEDARIPPLPFTAPDPTLADQ